MRIFATFILLLLAVLAGPLIVIASAPVMPDAPVLVIAAWGAETEARIAAAGGQVYSPARAPLGVLAYSSQPGFLTALHSAGAWFVIDGGRIAALCGVES